MKGKRVLYAIEDFVLTDEEVEILDRLNWGILSVDAQNGKVYVLIENYSPEGEDLVEFIWIEPGESFSHAVRRWANSFDQDEHVEMLVEHRGKRGVPETIKALVDDSKAIQKMFNNLASELEELEGAEDEEDFYSKEYRIPLVWQEYGFLWVEARSRREAIEKVLSSPDVPLPEGNYLDESLEVDEECEIEVRVWRNTGDQNRS